MKEKYTVRLVTEYFSLKRFLISLLLRSNMDEQNVMNELGRSISSVNNVKPKFGD